MHKMALVGLLATSIVSFGGGITASRWLHQKRTINNKLECVATVNEEKVTQDDLQIALSAYRRLAIEDMVQQRLILQAAQKRGLVGKNTPPDKPPEGIFPDEAEAMQRQARSQLARRQLILSRFPEDKKKLLFSHLGDELHQYTLIAIGLRDADEAKALSLELQAGTNFERMVSKYSVNLGLPDGNRLDNVVRSTVSQQLGPYVADSLLNLSPGQISPPNPSPMGPVVVKLLAVKQTFAELEPELDELLVESEGLATDYELGAQAFISSVYVQELGKKLKIQGPKPLQLASLKPTTAQPPRSLPRPRVVPLNALPRPPLVLKPTAVPTRFVFPRDQSTSTGILRANLEVVSHRLLAEGKVLRLDINDNHHADGDEPILVRITREGWKPVSQLSASVNRLDMEQDLGYWNDQAVTRPVGWWWQRQVVVERPSNGVAEPDEVSLHRIQRLKDAANTFEIGAEILRDAQGRLVQNQQIAHYGPNTAVEKSDLTRLRDYLDTDANWMVPRE